MKLKTFACLLTGLFLTACQSDNVPQDITAFLASLSVDKAISSLTSAKVDYSSTLVNSLDSALLGTMSVSIRVDRTDMKDYYSRVKDTFTGELCTLDEESSLYLTDASSHSYFDATDGYYHYDVLKHGYLTSEQTGDLQTYTKDSLFSQAEMESKAVTLFYSTSNAGLVSGGLYYGDFLKQHSRYHQFMAVEGDSLTYSYTHQVYKDDKEEGYGDESLTVDALGMLVSLRALTVNLTAKKQNSTTLSAIYNGVIDRE